MCIYIVYCLLTTVYETISSLFENSLAVNQKLQNLKLMVSKHDIYILAMQILHCRMPFVR